LLRISSRTEVTSLNIDLELADGFCSHSRKRLPLPLLCFVLFSALTGERGRRHRVLLKIGLLWDVAPCGWAGTNSRTSSLVRDKQALLAELLRLQVEEPPAIARNVAICDLGSTALHPNGR